MSNQYPSYAAATAEAEAAGAADRPDWAVREYPLEKGHGKVTSVEETSHMTDGGSALPFYEIHLSGHVSERAARPDAPAVLPVIQPKAGTGRNANNQPYFWTIASAKVDDIGGLVGKDITYELASRRRFETAKNAEFFYKISVVGTSNGAKVPAAPQFTDAELDEARDMIIGLDSATAVATIGQDKLSRLLVGSTKRVKQEEGVYVAL